MEETLAQPDPLLALLPLLFMSLVIGIVAHLLAKEKGRRVWLWTVLGLFPGVNIWCLPFFIGAANLRLEAKIDAILKGSRFGQDQPT